MSELKGQSSIFYLNPQKFCVFILASLPYCIIGNLVICDQSLKNVVVSAKQDRCWLHCHATSF